MQREEGHGHRRHGVVGDCLQTRAKTHQVEESPLPMHHQSAFEGTLRNVRWASGRGEAPFLTLPCHQNSTYGPGSPFSEVRVFQFVCAEPFLPPKFEKNPNPQMQQGVLDSTRQIDKLGNRLSPPPVQPPKWRVLIF